MLLDAVLLVSNRHLKFPIKRFMNIVFLNGLWVVPIMRLYGTISRGKALKVNFLEKYFLTFDKTC